MPTLPKPLPSLFSTNETLETDLAPLSDPHAAFPSSFAAYSASKQNALSSAVKFLAETRPSFDIIHILPAVILGANELVTSTAEFSTGTNRYAMNVVLGIDSPAPMVGGSVHVNDVGLLHVLALDEKVRTGDSGVRNFLACAGGVRWSDVNEIVRENFAKEVEEGVFKLGGKLDTNIVHFDVGATEREFGIHWTDFREQVRSVVGHYLKVKAKEEKSGI